MEWVLLILPLFAIIPGVGGALKGIGKLLLRLGKNAVEDRDIVAAMIQVCNRLGKGDEIKFIRELNFKQYQAQLRDGLTQVCKRLDDALRYLVEKTAFLPRDVVETLNALRAPLAKLQGKASEMIGKACAELDTRLQKVKELLPGYQAEKQVVQTGEKNLTREAEARIAEAAAPGKKPRLPNGHVQNGINDYQHVTGWPDLRKRVKVTDDVKYYETIAAFSGKMEAKTIKGPKTLYRVLHPVKNGKASPWWTETMPKDAQEWRERWAVLDEFNRNSFYMKYEVPAGTELKVWSGKAAEQFSETTKQYLPGGAEQIFVEWSAEMRADINKLPFLSTGWGKTLKLFGYEAETGASNAVRAEALGKTEYASKKIANTGK